MEKLVNHLKRETPDVPKCAVKKLIDTFLEPMKSTTKGQQMSHYKTNRNNQSASEEKSINYLIRKTLDVPECADKRVRDALASLGLKKFLTCLAAG